MVDEELPVAVAHAEGRRLVAVLGSLDAGDPFPVQRSPAGRGGSAQPEGRTVFAVGHKVGRDFHAGQRGDGGQEIDAADDRVFFDASGGDFARPAHEAEGADAAFVHAALTGAERAGAADAGVGGVTDAVVFGSVVAGEEDERIVGQPEFVEGIEQAADLGVQVGERSAEDLHLRAEVLGVGVILAGPFAEGGIIRLGLEFRVDGQLFRRRLQRGVRDERPEVDVEGLVLVGPGELDRLVDHQRRGAGAEVGLLAFVAKRRAGGILGLGHVDAIGLGGGRTGAVTEVPFAEVRGGVAGLLQEVGQGGDLGVEPVRHRTGGVLGMVGEMPVDAETGRDLSGHERGAAG